MPEVLSMLPDENQGELNSDEQDSLAVGEQLEQQHEGLLAGKYKNAEELESAYMELQKKLGSSEQEEETPEEEISEETADDFLDVLWKESTSNEYTEDTVKKLEGMSSSDLANLYLNYRQQVESSAPARMTEQDAEGLKNVVGGEDNYNNMIQWASQNLSEQDIDMYDRVMDQGDPIAAYFAVQALAYRYQDSIGTEGNMVQGKAPNNTRDVFQSQAEVVRAMSDPRYERDPAYRQQIMEKLANSNIDF